MGKLLIIIVNLSAAIISSFGELSAEKAPALIWIQHADVIEHYLSIRQAAGI